MEDIVQLLQPVVVNWKWLSVVQGIWSTLVYTYMPTFPDLVRIFPILLTVKRHSRFHYRDSKYHTKSRFYKKYTPIYDIDPRFPTGIQNSALVLWAQPIRNRDRKTAITVYLCRVSGCVYIVYICKGVRCCFDCC